LLGVVEDREQRFERPPALAGARTLSLPVEWNGKVRLEDMMVDRWRV